MPICGGEGDVSVGGRERENGEGGRREKGEGGEGRREKEGEEGGGEGEKRCMKSDNKRWIYYINMTDFQWGYKNTENNTQ